MDENGKLDLYCHDFYDTLLPQELLDRATDDFGVKVERVEV